MSHSKLQLILRDDSVLACSPGYLWVGQKDPETAWKACERPDWMVWAIPQLLTRSGETMSKLYAAMYDCLRFAAPLRSAYLKELKAIELLESGCPLPTETTCSGQTFYTGILNSNYNYKSSTLLYVRIENLMHLFKDFGERIEHACEKHMCNIIRRHLPYDYMVKNLRDRLAKFLFSDVV